MVLEDVESFLDIIKTKDIVIYGTGYVADRFFDALVIHGIDEKVRCFVTSERNKKMFKGREVQTVAELDVSDNTIICIAVHESICDEIKDELKQRKYYKYIWIYPLLWDLIIGKPIRKNVKVPIEKIIREACSCYALATRYLVIDSYKKKEKIGYDIYVKVMSLYSDEETSKKRLEQFIRLIECIEKKQFDNERCIKISENGCIIDGNHRVALMSYYGYKNIKCDIYPEPTNGIEVNSEAAFATKTIIEKAGFTKKELNALERARRRINDTYGIDCDN